MFRALLSILISVELAVAPMAATITAASPSRADVSTAVTSASENDTIAIPAGSATWTSRLDVTKSLTFQGAGTNAAGANYTEITVNITSDYAFDIRQSNTNNKTRITGITFKGTNCTGAVRIGAGNGESLAAYKGSTWEIDRCHFIMNANRGISAFTPCYGVAHDNLFSGYGQATGLNIFGRGASNTYTAASIQYGISNVVFLEHNTMIWDSASGGANGAIDCYDGAQLVARFNTGTNINFGGHGLDSGGVGRGSPFGGEVYGNTIVETVGIAAFQFRGGTWLIYSNTVTGPGNASGDVNVYHYRTSGTNIYGGTTPCCNPWGPAYPTNQWDGGGLGIGYPSYQQIGWTGPVTYGATNTTQVSSPLYYWANTFNGSPTTVRVGNNFTNSGTSGGWDLSLIPSASQMLVDGRDMTNAVFSYSAYTYPHPLTTTDAVTSATIIYSNPKKARRR